MFPFGNDAPGRPGSPPTWSASRKSAVGTAKNLNSRLWFTLGEGIVTELYSPRIDLAATRDFGFFVTDGNAFFSDEQHDATHQVAWLADGVPAFEVVNTCRQGRYRITKKILANPDTHALLQHTTFEPLTPGDYRVYARVAPHLMNHGGENEATVGDYKGDPMLLARHDGFAMAMAGDAPWLKRSVGYVGVSDSRADLVAHKAMTVEYARAANGNVAMTGEIDLAACGNAFCLTLAFGRDQHEAGQRARHTLAKGFDRCWDQYRKEWEDWHATQSPDPLGHDTPSPGDGGASGHETSGDEMSGHEAAGLGRRGAGVGSGRFAVAPAKAGGFMATRPGGGPPVPQGPAAPPPARCDGCTPWRVSQAVLAVHESKDFRGGLIASLSSPWGKHRGDANNDGYHVVWPRDCCETVGAMVAAGAGEECERVIAFLRATQEADGHWPQSMWLSGMPAQNGTQLDEVALPILAIDQVRRDPRRRDPHPAG